MVLSLGNTAISRKTDIFFYNNTKLTKTPLWSWLQFRGKKKENWYSSIEGGENWYCLVEGEEGTDVLWCEWEGGAYKKFRTSYTFKRNGSILKCIFHVQDVSESLGISIAGGVMSQRGDTPVYVTNINQGGCIGRCRQVKVSSSCCKKFWVSDVHMLHTLWFVTFSKFNNFTAYTDCFILVIPLSYKTRCYCDLWFALLGEAGDVWCLPLSGISGLSFDSTLLSPLLFFCLLPLLSLSCLFFILLSLRILLTFFLKILQHFSFGDRLFGMAFF